MQNNRSLPCVTVLVVIAAMLSVRPADAQKNKVPALIIRDTGGFAGPDLDFVVFSNLTWKYTARGANKANKQGKITAEELDAIVAELKKAGLEEAKSIRPSPAPHSQIRVDRGNVKINVFLARDDTLMKAARKLVLKQVR